jgi:DNA polymerase-3 subunit delta'
MISSNDNKDITIDEIRNLNKFIRLSPALSDYKIVIIDDSDRLNINAANALLKILEEPHNCIFFLICHNLAKLPSTILSRCRKIKLKNLSLEESLEIISDEDVDPVAMRKILLLTQNSPALALKLYHLDVLKIYQNLLTIVASLLTMDLSKINKWHDSFKGDDQWEIFSLLINRLLMQIIKYDYQSEYIINDEKEMIENIHRQCNMESLIDLWERLQILLQETTNSYLDQKQVILVIFQLIQQYCGFKK